MFGRRILILLHFSILPFCFASEGKHLAKHLFSDEEIQEDVKAVDLVIQAPWVEQNTLGVQRMETKRESNRLTDAQKALFDRHWELETIQLEKPEAPKQVDLELLAEALDIVVEMNPDEKEVVIRMDKLNEWAKEEKDANKNKKELDLNLTKSIEEEKKEAKGRISRSLSQLLKLDMKEKEEEEESKGEEKGKEEEKQCSEQDKQKFLLNKSIESPIQQQNRTETIFEKINGISGNWWHFAENKQPMEVKTNENKEDKPFVIFGGENEDVGENEEKEKKEERLQESNENEVFAQIQKGKELRAERPSEMVVVDMNSDEDNSDVESSEEDKIEAEIEEKEEPMMEIVEIVDLNKENDDEDNDDDDEDDNSSTSEEEIKEEKSTGIFSVLTNLLFGGGRFKREAFPFPAIPNSTKIVEQSDVNSGDNIEKIKIIKSFSGRVKLGDKNVEFSGSKLEITKDLGEKEEKNEKEKRQEFLKEIFDNDKKIEDLKEEENKIVEKEKELTSDEKKMEKENEKTENVGEKENIKLTEKAKIAKYLTEMLTKTSEDRPKRDEKIAYVWYCELQYWVAKFVEKEFSLKDNKNESGNVGKILDEMDVIVGELEYIRSIWGKILGKLAELTDFIGKEFKRRK
uniref:Uncharacterized protein n=1 Tax=Meloidogyne enterolobii TaxID=390850 RepID=A0A6V7VGL0_MELEN|nr:unnamed protein product [Meloidogyne enterolobii]